MKLFNKIVSLVVMAAALCFIFAGCSNDTTSSAVQNTAEEGKLQVTVVDKSTKAPISDAKVIIVGIDNSYKTDEKGKSPVISLEVNKDVYKKYGDALAKKAPSGSSTVLISKEGYKDYIIFNKAIYPGYSANNLNVQMTKLNVSDKDKYTIDYQYPHELWLEELLNFCGNIKDEGTGSGECSLKVSIKDQNATSVQDAVVSIPELNIKTKTDKSGNAAFVLPSTVDTATNYPVKRELSEYTVVVTKDGYVPSIAFNATTSTSSGNSMSITLKSSKAKDAGKYSVSYNPYEREWIEKLINSYNE